MANRTFAENENRDIFLASNNNIEIIDDLEAISQLIKSAVEIQQGEAIFSTQRGIPTDRVLFTGSPNLQQFEFFARKQILSIDGVIEVLEFNAQSIDNVTRYSALVKTIYGEQQINGGL